MSYQLGEIVHELRAIRKAVEALPKDIAKETAVVHGIDIRQAIQGVGVGIDSKDVQRLVGEALQRFSSARR